MSDMASLATQVEMKYYTLKSWVTGCVCSLIFMEYLTSFKGIISSEPLQILFLIDWFAPVAWLFICTSPRERKANIVLVNVGSTNFMKIVTRTIKFFNSSRTLFKTIGRFQVPWHCKKAKYVIRPIFSSYF